MKHQAFKAKLISELKALTKKLEKSKKQFESEHAILEHLSDGMAAILDSNYNYVPQNKKVEH